MFVTRTRCACVQVAGQGMLRIFGNGFNRICFSHVDNYAHGLILGAPALYKGSPALGEPSIDDKNVCTNCQGTSMRKFRFIRVSLCEKMKLDSFCWFRVSYTHLISLFLSSFVFHLIFQPFLQASFTSSPTGIPTLTRAAASPFGMPSTKW